jgi:DNA-3-methyladenine glycosylase II
LEEVRAAAAAPPYDTHAAVAHLRAADPKLAPLLDRVGPCRLSCRPLGDPYQALLESIVYQQLNGRAAATIYGRVCALFSARRPPRPREIVAAPAELLRGAGLSNAKMLAVKDLSARAIAREIPTAARLARMADDAIVETLTQVRGIGPWTVEMLLLFGLGRPDVLPATDFGVRKGFAVTYRKRDLPEPKALLQHGERWRPFRSVASWYLWRAADEAAAK